LNTKKLAETIILIAIAIIAIVFLVFYRPVSLWGDTRYEPVYTGSMEPAIPVGSVVVIKPVDPETLKTGDVICFKLSEPTTTVTHRLFNITNEGFITKGDANEDPDQWTVKKENVIGKVILTIPFIGYIGYFVRTPIGFILLIILPASLIIILEIRNIIKELRKKTRTKKPNKHPTTVTKQATLLPLFLVFLFCCAASYSAAKNCCSR
jgi:signal peptidase